MILTIVGATCAIVSIIDVGLAIYFAMTERLLQAWVLATNFALLAYMVQFGIFG
jgi:hypothetical protein